MQLRTLNLYCNDDKPVAEYTFFFWRGSSESSLLSLLALLSTFISTSARVHELHTDIIKTLFLGLDKIHEATDGRGCRLRVDLWTFDDDHAFAEYRLDFGN